MKCPNCANEIPEGRKACGFCGVKIISAENFLCPNCGEELPAGIKACGYCGTLLEKSPIVTKKAPKPEAEKKAPQPKPVKAKQTRKVASKSKPVKKVMHIKPTEKEPARKAGLPKWMLPVVVGVVIVAVVLVVLLSRGGGDSPSQSSSGTNSTGSASTTSTITPRALSGTWHGEDITVTFDNNCAVNATCGNFTWANGTTGSLKITFQDGNKFGFVNPLGDAEVYEEWVRYINDDRLEMYSNSEFGESHQFLTRQ